MIVGDFELLDIPPPPYELPSPEEPAEERVSCLRRLIKKVKKKFWTIFGIGIIVVFLAGMSIVIRSAAYGPAVVSLYTKPEDHTHVFPHRKKDHEMQDGNDARRLGKRDTHWYRERLHTIETPGCHLPFFPAKSQFITDFTRSNLREDPLCASFNGLSDPDFKFGSERPPLFESSATALHLQPALLERYGIALPQATQCFLRAIFPKLEPYERNEALKCKSTICHTPLNETGVEYLPLLRSVHVPSYMHFAQLFCLHFKENVHRIVYNDFAGFIHRNDTELKLRCKKAGTCDQLHHMICDFLFNVVVIGIDAGSRLNRKRNLVETHKVLTNLLDVVELRGYNTVANTTLSSFTSVVAGMTADELHDNCWESDRKACPKFVWEKFAERGFATSFIEDPPTEASGVRGFGTLRRSAVDHFGSPLIDEALKTQGHTNIHGVNVCAGPRHTASMVLHYGTQFMAAHADHPHFGVMWLHSTTDAEMNILRMLDRPLAAALRDMHGKKLLDRTVFLLIAGRGSGDNNPGFRATAQGKAETANPFGFFYLPKTFRDTYPLAFEAVQNNAKRLVTPFDVHNTLLSLVDPVKYIAAHAATAEPDFSAQQDVATASEFHVAVNGSKQDLVAATDNSAPKRQVVSLFDPISTHRTCDQAGIQPSFCVCARRSMLSITDFVEQMAHRMLTYLNVLLELQPGCEKLELQDIVHAEQQLRDDETTYFLRFLTAPGRMLFEATLVPDVPDKPNEYSVTMTNMASPVHASLLINPCRQSGPNSRNVQ